MKQIGRFHEFDSNGSDETILKDVNGCRLAIYKDVSGHDYLCGCAADICTLS